MTTSLLLRNTVIGLRQPLLTPWISLPRFSKVQLFMHLSCYIPCSSYSSTVRMRELKMVMVGIIQKYLQDQCLEVNTCIVTIIMTLLIFLEEKLTISYSRSSGPGGQNVNKRELRRHPATSHMGQTLQFKGLITPQYHNTSGAANQIFQSPQ